jgi:DinB family protein
LCADARNQPTGASRSRNETVTQAIDIPDATLHPAEYVEALIKTLGGRDPLRVYEQTATEVTGVCSALKPHEWTQVLAPDEWSPLQLVGHLLDVDIVYGFRWRLVLTEDCPAYPGYNEKAWSLLARPGPVEVLQAFLALRGTNVALLRGLAEDDFGRQGVHSQQGRENVKKMLDKIAGHDLAHLNQLVRTIESIRTRC